MSKLLLNYGIASYINHNVLIIPFQSDFYSEVMDGLKRDVSQKLVSSNEIKGLILDLSKVKVIDLSNMRNIERLLDMAKIFGVQAYVSGIQPLVTMALIELGYEPWQLNSAINIEQAMDKILASSATSSSDLEQYTDNDVDRADDDNRHQLKDELIDE